MHSHYESFYESLLMSAPPTVMASTSPLPQRYLTISSSTKAFAPQVGISASRPHNAPQSLYKRPREGPKELPQEGGRLLELALERDLKRFKAQKTSQRCQAHQLLARSESASDRSHNRNA